MKAANDSIAELKGAISALDAKVDAKVSALETKIIKWIVTTVLASAGLAFTIANGRQSGQYGDGLLSHLNRLGPRKFRFVPGGLVERMLYAYSAWNEYRSPVVLPAVLLSAGSQTDSAQQPNG